MGGRHLWWGVAALCLLMAVIIPSYTVKAPLVVVGVILFWVGMGRRFLVPAIISTLVVALSISATAAIHNLAPRGLLERLFHIDVPTASVDFSTGRDLPATEVIPGTFTDVEILGEKRVRLTTSPDGKLRVSRGVEVVEKSGDRIKLKVHPAGDNWPTIELPKEITRLDVKAAGTKVDGNFTGIDEVFLKAGGVKIGGTLVGDLVQIDAAGVHIEGKLGAKAGTISAVGVSMKGTIGGIWEISAIGVDMDVRAVMLKRLNIKAKGASGRIIYTNCPPGAVLGIQSIGADLTVLKPRGCNLSIQKAGVGVNVRVLERD